MSVCVCSVCTFRIYFLELHARLRSPNNLFTLRQIGPDFPSLADEIAEQRPDMNIKVTACTVSKKFYYTKLRYYTERD